MKAKELIDILSKLDPDTEVVVPENRGMHVRPKTLQLGVFHAKHDARFGDWVTKEEDEQIKHKHSNHRVPALLIL